MEEKEFYLYLGEKIRELRKQKGLSQEELSKAAGIKQSFLSQLENQGKKLSAYRINRILKVLGYSIEAMLDPEKKKTSILPFPGRG